MSSSTRWIPSSSDEWLDTGAAMTKNAVVTLSCSWVVAIILGGCSGRVANRDVDAVSKVSASVTALSPEIASRVRQFCGDCHPLPLPSTFPKANWAEEVQQGFDFYIQSNRTDLDEPIRRDAVKYFQDLAPEKVLVPRADDLKSIRSSVRFERGRGEGTGISDSTPATAHVVWNALEKTVYFTDMRAGSLRTCRAGSETQPLNSIDHERVIWTGVHSCRVQLCDWDQDGYQDYLVGELGSFPVGDHENGRISLLLGKPNGEVESIVLAEKLGRVVEARPFDYDGDGDTDVLVAEFGWRKTGGLRLLRNMGGDLRSPKMQLENIDTKHGALGVEIGDLDGDSKLDFVVAYGQEFETVEVYLNRGGGEFEHRVIGHMPDPSYNSSSIQLADIDHDGRLDIVHTCGDTMDALLPKPYHGLRWMRNLGNGNWETRELGLLVGALHSTVADFDGDGDLDIAAVGLFPEANHESPGAYDSICWWEQKDDLQFTRHSVERDDCAHACCTSGDVNGDGRIDLIVGSWLAKDRSSFRVFLNLPSEQQ